MNLIKLLIIFLATLLFSCNSNKNTTQLTENIRVNQLGFYPKSVKQFIVVNEKGASFEIVNEKGTSVYEGNLQNNGTWEASGEEVLLGDFSEVTIEGTYTIVIDKKLKSNSFKIQKNLYNEALNASIKSFYFQRASIPIEEKFGGIYNRKSGHPDNNCTFHPSTGHSTGSLNSPGGWYDAGDYGKYIVNAAISTGQMLQLIELFPTIIPDNSLNIPESGNGITDIWDELKYELDWIITMQDTDGGVYHKLTSKTFCGFIMPEEDTDERFIIGKGTAATLNFSAVFAQASRLYTTIDSNWSETALKASEKAWDWALASNNIPYINPADIQTGPYDDTEFSDDFYWAATELFLATKNEKYLDYIIKNPEPHIHKLTNSWKFFVRNNAFHSLIENKSLLETTMAATITKNQIKLADSILQNISKNPYKIGLEHFEWGSNSDVLNQAMILCVTHRLTKDEKYLIGAEQITDYIFGKNATGYSFLTGFGSKQALFIHHRPSGADSIANPIPGFIVGGPNNDKQDIAEVTYISSLSAKSYMDVEASFASNEVCINWNAPAVFVLGYLQQVRNN